jgi:HSP20 family protein
LEEKIMTIKDLIPWNKGRSLPVNGSEDHLHPFLAMHREMNRMFDDMFRGFDLAPLSMDRRFGAVGWPIIDIDDTGKEIRITAELPGLDEKDVELQIANGVLSISGEKKSETENKERRFSERFFGRFERRIALEDVDEQQAQASFRNGVLTVIVPKLQTANESVRRIAINSEG